ncbi:MAG TPA: TIGR02266 family protein [Thermoanaerobaculia bacterium]|nr:TIGR02266 family protein [Thermoanaerobaculia bacterium]HUM31300.1 TIGR02266 family protein [Thermoanaerobaculia bacterium]HXK69654.1 TIGR02266 family protein [Thermoanaerobaculia bacterium]
MDQKRILVGNLPQSIVEKVSSYLSRDHFSVDYLPSTKAVNALIVRVPFHLLILGIPVEDMRIEDLFHSIRTENMPCIKSPVLLLGSSSILDDYRKYIGKGASSVLDGDLESLTLVGEIGRLMEVAPRVEARLLVHMRVHMESRQGNLLCQCENISTSGMLIKTSSRYDPGTRLTFEFTMPGDRDPIQGEAEVVRHTVHPRDKVSGMGLRFISMDEDGRERLERHLSQTD